MPNVTVERRKAAGLCIRCGKVPPKEGILHCEPCRQKAIRATVNYAAHARIKRRQQGLCKCGAAPLEGRKMCAACQAYGREKQMLFATRNVSKGLCHCGKPKTEGKNSCPKCRAASLTKMARRKAKGLCYRCPAPAIEGRHSCGKHLKLARRKAKARNAAYRRQVFDHYGWTCLCCGETIQEFLTLDHINGGGTRHRKSLKGGKSGTTFYRWVVENGYPDDLQTLCMNCNWGRRWYGECPHERARREQSKG